MSYLKKGNKGYFGRYTDNNKNVIVDELDKLIDEYNAKINLFDTELENNIFHDMMNDKIENIYKTKLYYI